MTLDARAWICVFWLEYTPYAVQTRRPVTSAQSSVSRPTTAPIMSREPPVVWCSGSTRCRAKPINPATKIATATRIANLSVLISQLPARSRQLAASPRERKCHDLGLAAPALRSKIQRPGDGRLWRTDFNLGSVQSFGAGSNGPSGGSAADDWLCRAVDPRRALHAFG